MSRLELFARTVAAEFSLPVELLLSVVYSESRFAVVSLDKGGKGWVRLVPWRQARSPARASALLKVAPEAIAHDPKLGLRATAALLAATQQEVGNAAENGLVLSWHQALERFNGGADPAANRMYADQVLKLARRGFEGVDEANRRILVPPNAQVIDELPSDELAAGAKPPAGVVGAGYVPFWTAATTTHRPLPQTPRPLNYIVIHTMENTFSTIFEFFRRPGTQVASHYMVRAFDGMTIQLVDERIVSFHDACFNEESIGIEIEGYVGTGDWWFSESAYRAAGKLVRDIAQRHHIPLDRQHVLGHSETPTCSDHKDPGPAWNWDHLMWHASGHEESEG